MKGGRDKLELLHGSPKVVADLLVGEDERTVLGVVVDDPCTFVRMLEIPREGLRSGAHDNELDRAVRYEIPREDLLSYRLSFVIGLSGLSATTNVTAKLNGTVRVVLSTWLEYHRTREFVPGSNFASVGHGNKDFVSLPQEREIREQPLIVQPITRGRPNMRRLIEPPEASVPVHRLIRSIERLSPFDNSRWLATALDTITSEFVVGELKLRKVDIFLACPQARKTGGVKSDSVSSRASKI